MLITMTHLLHMGHSVSNQQGILGHFLDFDETWSVCSTYGAHHSYQLLTMCITYRGIGRGVRGVQEPPGKFQH